jgi:hypothetical protein
LSIKNHHFNETIRDVQTMGACLSIEREEGKARKRSEEIDRQLGELAKQQNNVIKILLLGKLPHCIPPKTPRFVNFRRRRERQEHFGQTDENYTC